MEGEWVAGWVVHWFWTKALCVPALCRDVSTLNFHQFPHLQQNAENPQAVKVGTATTSLPGAAAADLVSTPKKSAAKN